MSEPFRSQPPRERDREAWVESQVWRRCVEARRAGGETVEVAPLRPRLEVLREVVSASRALASELRCGSEETAAEEERLLRVAQHVALISSLPPRRAPRALDAVLDQLETLADDEPQFGLEDGLAAASEGGAPLPALVLARYEDQDRELRDWLSALAPQRAPAELDARFEQALAEHCTATELVPAAEHRAAREQRTGTEHRASEARARIRLLRRRVVAWSAAALILGAVGLGLLWREFSSGSSGVGAESGAPTRFSFRYVDVESAGADVASRPALRLLRGWASHISASSLDLPSAPR
jgi:hypothetical protein